VCDVSGASDAEIGALSCALQRFIALHHPVDTDHDMSRQKRQRPPIPPQTARETLEVLRGTDLEDLAREKEVPAVRDRRVGVAEQSV